MCEVYEKENILKTSNLVNLDYLCTRRRKARPKSGGFPVLKDEQTPVDLSCNISLNDQSLYPPSRRPSHQNRRAGHLPTVSRPRPTSEVLGTRRSILERAAKDQTC